MSCNSCAQPFTLLRKEKGCPSCGFSFCSKCLTNKAFVKKLNKEVKVCHKCKVTAAHPNTPKIEPPDAYLKRTNTFKDGDLIPTASQGVSLSATDKEIQERLAKLKEGKPPEPSVEEMTERLRILQNIPATSDAELQSRLAKLKGVPTSSVSNNKPQLITTDRRTEQEQADDLLKQYLAQVQLDNVYKDDFDTAITGIEERLQKLKGSQVEKKEFKPVNESDSEDDETVDQIVKKYSAEAVLEGSDKEGNTDELPFCEICNEDATVRCLGCRYIFCKRCFNDHKDDDDGCNKYETYKPKNTAIS